MPSLPRSASNSRNEFGLPTPPRSRPSSFYDPSATTIAYHHHPQQQQQQQTFHSPSISSSERSSSFTRRGGSLSPVGSGGAKRVGPANFGRGVDGGVSDPLVINIDAPIQTPSRAASSSNVVARHTVAVQSTPSRTDSPLVHVGGGLLASPSSPLARANQEVEMLRKMLGEREAELTIRGEQYRAEQREWSDVLRLNQDELALSRRTVEALKTELHEAQSREQQTVAQMDSVQHNSAELQKRSEDRETEILRLQEVARKRSEELYRLEELCAARAKELSIVTVSRARGEKRAAALQSELEESEHQLSKLKESTGTKIATLTNQVERLQSELREAHGKQERILQESNDAVSRLTADVQRLSEDLSAENRLRVQLEAERRDLRLEREEERGILQQCDTTMTALDDENKSLQESNDALRGNADRLGGTVQEQASRIEILSQDVAHLKDINVSLRADLLRTENARAALEGQLADVSKRFDAVCDELDATTDELGKQQRAHTASLTEVQHAHVTLKWQSEEEIATLRSRVNVLEQELHEAKKQYQAAKTEAERVLVQAVSDREVELLREAAAKRQDLVTALTREFESDPRVSRYGDMQRQQLSLVSQLEKCLDFFTLSKSAVVRFESQLRCSFEETVDTFFGLLRTSAIELPAQFDALLKTHRAAEANLQGRVDILSSALESSTSELAVVRSELEKYQSVPNMDFLVTSRVDVIKGIAELVLRSRLTRRRLRSLFALPSWRLLLKEQLIPDDFGQMLCDIVDDFQWTYDKHRDMANANFTASERQRWGIQTNIHGSDDPPPPPRSASSSAAQMMASSSSPPHTNEAWRTNDVVYGRDL